MSMSVVAGVDSSTQSCTIVVCDADSGDVLRSARAPHPPGTEVPAQAWLDAFREATRDPDLLADVEAMAVGGVFGLPVTVTDVAESVSIGAARQAAWALTGALPEWPVPQVSHLEASQADVRAAAAVDERYRAVVSEHYMRLMS
jgi:sugar (pentulose or hexulose) kinase